MGEWTSPIWFFFPFGIAGVRALLLTIPALLVYLLRIQQWHTGRRNTFSPLDTLWTHALRLRTLYTIGIYALSAYIYGEVYIWSRASQKGFQFIAHGKLHERTKLNERPIFLRFLFLTLAVLQGCRHVWLDYDRVRVSPKKAGTAAKSTPQYLIASMAPLVSQAGIFVASSFVVGATVYFVCGFRYWFWGIWFSFMRKVISLGKISRPTGVAPFAPLIGVFISQGTLLMVLWQFSNMAFDYYLAKEPLKHDKPITSDSKDPEGSLLNGLKSKKVEVKNTALWELALITTSFPDRRRAIYADIKRAKAPTPKQITAICLAEIRDLTERCKHGVNPSQASADQKQPAASAPFALVPRIAEPLREDKITSPVPPPRTKLEKFEFISRELAQNHSSPKYVEDSIARVNLARGQKAATDAITKAESTWEQYKTKLARSPVGWFFRHSLRRAANVQVFSYPYSRSFALSNAITALTNLTVHSIEEDVAGMYQREVPEIIRVLAAALKAVQAYTASLAPHWTDVETMALPEEKRREVPEVEELVAELKEGLSKVVGKFGEYADGIGMSRAEMREVKELVGDEKRATAGGSVSSR